MSPTHRECGYEIHRSDDEILLIDRKTWPLYYVMGILGAVAIVMIALGVIVALDAADGLSGVPLAALFGLAAALVVVAGAIWRLYKRRCDLPLSEVADGLVVDLRAGVLRDRQGDMLSPLDRVCVAVRIDWWWTRTLMRLVVVSWPEGRKIVFRTVNRWRAREVMQTLQGLGISKPS